MDLRFHVDAETGDPHIHVHGVSEEEVDEVLRHPADDFPGREGSRIALGPTDAGRILQIVYSPDADGRGAFVITAYDLRG